VGALDDLRKALDLNGGSVDEWALRLEARPGPIPVKSLLRQAGEAVYPLLSGAKSNREQEEARAFEKLGAVVWGLKAELERNMERPGDWVPEIRQIWPEAAPGGASKTR
jgi:hypothetical protein